MAETWMFLGRHLRDNSRKNRRSRLQESKRNRRQRSKLSIEALEVRSLLATASFLVNLYQDDHGIPGAEISHDSLEVGQSFFVEITAKEHDPDFRGLQGVSLDIAWDPTILREVDPVFDPADPLSDILTSNFPMYRGGTLNNEAGTIENLTGVAFPPLELGRTIGDGVAERFALLRFQAMRSSDGTLLEMRQGQSQIATSPPSSLGRRQIYFEPQSITVLAVMVEPTIEQTTGQTSEKASTESAVVNVESTDGTNPPAPHLEAGYKKSDGLVGSNVPNAAEEITLGLPMNDLGPVRDAGEILYSDCGVHGSIPSMTISAMDVSFAAAVSASDDADAVSDLEFDDNEVANSIVEPLQWMLVAYAPQLPNGYEHSSLAREEYLSRFRSKSSDITALALNSTSTLAAYVLGGESSAKPVATSPVDSDAMVDKVLASGDLGLSATDKIEHLLDLIVGK